MDYIKQFYGLQKVKDLLNQLNNLSHAVMLNSKDSVFLDCFAKLLVLKNCCKQSEICFECASCKKILNQSSVDVEYFGYQKPLVVEDSAQIVADSFVVPLEFEEKYFVIKEIQNATLPAQNKLLKVIEEPQKFDRFIFTTTNLDAVLPTIKSRCQIVNLPKLTNPELTLLFDYKLNDAKHFNVSLDYAQGNLTKLDQLYNDQNFMQLFDLTLDMLANMRNSSMVLQYSGKILSFGGEFNKFLQILSSFFADMLCIKQKRQNLVLNKQVEVQLNIIANGYSELAIVNIQKYIDEVAFRCNFNANLNALVDNLLLKILEIKFLCK